MAAITKYLLPCECGRKVPVEPGQAGQTVVCECGSELTVPSMRGVRALEAVQVETEKRLDVRESNWNATRGILFSLGLLVGVIALGFALLQYQALRGIGKVYSEEEATVLIDASIDEMDAEQIYHAWTEIQTHGIGPKNVRPPYILVGQAAGRMKIAIAIAAVIGVLSLIGAIAAITVSRNKQS